MSERKKIGVEVSADTYERFKQYVEEKTGRERGVLGEHLDRAMSEYVGDESDRSRLERVENDMASVNRNVAELTDLLRHAVETGDEAEADGSGAALTLSRAEGTHTHREQGTDETNGTSPDSRPENDRSNEQADDHTDEQSNATVPDEPPHPKASRAKKAAWVAGQFEGINPDSSLARAALEKKVGEAYAFGDEATEALVEAAADRLDLEPHPTNENMLVGEAQFDRVLAEAENETSDDAADEFDDLAAGHPANDD